MPACLSDCLPVCLPVFSAFSYDLSMTVAVSACVIACPSECFDVHTVCLNLNMCKVHSNKNVSICTGAMVAMEEDRHPAKPLLQSGGFAAYSRKGKDARQLLGNSNQINFKLLIKDLYSIF